MVVDVDRCSAARRGWSSWSCCVVGLVAALRRACTSPRTAIDRPRPAGPLVDDGGLQRTRAGTPPTRRSGWPWRSCSRASCRGIASRAALVGGALVLAAAIGLSRIYLRAHYWSDVAGGWGLGAGVFGLCAAIALIVAYLRHNEVRPRRAAVREPTR